MKLLIRSKNHSRENGEQLVVEDPFENDFDTPDSIAYFDTDFQLTENRIVQKQPFREPHRQPISSKEYEDDSDFDLIEGDLRMKINHLISATQDLQIENREKRCRSIIVDSVQSLKTSGHAFFIIDPGVLFRSPDLNTILGGMGFHIEAVLRLPPHILDSFPPLPLFISISAITDNLEKTYFQDIDFLPISSSNPRYPSSHTWDTSGFLQRFKNKDDSPHIGPQTTSNKLKIGVWDTLKNFQGFDEYIIKNEMWRLTNEDKRFTKKTIAGLSKKVYLPEIENDVDALFLDDPNSIYFPPLQYMDVDSINQFETDNFEFTVNFTKSPDRPTKFIRIDLDDSKTLNLYLVYFFNTDLGKALISKLYQEGVLREGISKDEIKNIEIVLPDLPTQLAIVEYLRKKERLDYEVQELHSLRSLHPKNMAGHSDKLERCLDSLLDITPETIERLIRAGESNTVEFKATLNRNIITGNADPDMKMVVLRAISSFLNSNGGILLIGVNNDGSIRGIESDIDFHEEEYLRKIDGLVRTHITPQPIELVHSQTLECGGKKVICIECKRSDKPLFLDKIKTSKYPDGKLFYIRDGSSSILLEGPDLLNYHYTHFQIPLR
ncbi:MAG: RNA-binding domain-containing protein [Nanoarchaeota archaeon]